MPLATIEITIMEAIKDIISVLFMWTMFQALFPLSVAKALKMLASLFKNQKKTLQ